MEVVVAVVVVVGLGMVQGFSESGGGESTNGLCTDHMCLRERLRRCQFIGVMHLGKLSPLLSLIPLPFTLCLECWPIGGRARDISVKLLHSIGFFVSTRNREQGQNNPKRTSLFPMPQTIARSSSMAVPPLAPHVSTGRTNKPWIESQSSSSSFSSSWPND